MNATDRVNRRFLLISYVRTDLRTIGPLYIYSYAKEHHVDITLLYVNVDDELNVDGLRDFLIKNDFGVIGIGLTTMEYYYSVSFTEAIRQILPKAFIFWGGGARNVCTRGVL